MIKTPKVPEKAILDWQCSSDKQYHCIFCGNHGNHNHFLNSIQDIVKPIFGCGTCKEYKGVEPCIPGYCKFGKE